MYRLLEIGEQIRLGDEMLFEVPDGSQKGAWRWAAVPASCVGENVTVATVPIKRELAERGELRALRLIERTQREQIAREQSAIKKCLDILKAREQSWKAGMRDAKRLLKEIEAAKKTR